MLDEGLVVAVVAVALAAVVVVVVVPPLFVVSCGTTELATSHAPLASVCGADEMALSTRMPAGVVALRRLPDVGNTVTPISYQRAASAFDRPDGLLLGDNALCVGVPLTFA